MTEPLARAEFDFTLDEAAEVAWRIAQHLRSLRSQPWTAAILAAVLVGLALPGVLWLLGLDRSRSVLIATTALAAAVAGTIAYLRFGHWYRRSMRRVIREVHGAGPNRCIVELHEDRVEVHQDHNVLTFPWPQVDTITDEDGDIFLLSNRGGVAVRRRAFASDDEHRAFLALARQLAGRSTT